ncbi:3-hydroxyacyl-CoA dehydrogenase family protein [Papillibacter cinnamivorans]|uniref:3-hydroxybutyryl-CoA dehydrogenase n=1 Tax=Papillibacter cinnamivorans DSM 12816 TaxID=1122930 RepID=A0A1W2BVW5_9FIRM|nr:3-hydroxyacyl-CoA dehydrogenase family protein [Papillibacter cinnamivorans]SMC77110.1 3-hydroxybutyryl-CoA dehydrogenase [Papillibacter cinnamivorans DSM 12816]
MKEIKTIGILGAGTMGGNLAQLAATRGFEVLLYDIEARQRENALSRTAAALDKGISRGSVTGEEKEAVLGRIQGTASLEQLEAADFVIEAVVEDLKVKQELFSRLDGICREDTVLCSNTSSMSITSIAAATKRADRVAGMHFFNPPTVMKLVEVIRGYHTSEETAETVKQTAAALGRTPAEVRRDTPGFVVNRCLFPFLLEAIHIYEEGIATKEDIDTAVKLGLNFPMGPFELMDLAGLDTFIPITEYFFSEFKDPKWNAPQSIRAVIRAGRYGRKNGRGWYTY